MTSNLTFESRLERFGSQDHPERLPNEVFIGNFTESNYSSVGYKTKRMGKFAICSDGTFMNSYSQKVLFPVFVDKLELEQYFNANFNLHKFLPQD